MVTLILLLQLLQLFFTYQKNKNQLLCHSGTIKIQLKGSAFFDPHEIKLIKAIIETENKVGLAVLDINSILNLTNLSEENQRQRRHIIFKELNLKLFLITGIRECVSRIPSENDKRVINYKLVSGFFKLPIAKKII